MKKKRVLPAALLAAIAIMLVGCSSSPPPEDTAGGRAEAPSAAGAPVDGGSLSFSSHVQAADLDPTRVTARGDSGGTELAAVYDVLMRYDNEQRDFVPHLAASLTADDAGTRWTLTLREDVRFSDGTALDAAAVGASIDRYNAARGDGAALWEATVTETRVTDSTTVEFLLDRPWPSFPAMLALGHGMIVGAEADTGENFTAIGAGPFIEKSYQPGDQRVMTANPDYWNGRPHLDEVRFIALGGPQANAENLLADGVEAAVIRGNPEAIDSVLDAGLPGYATVLNSGGAELINNRDGRPGGDVRVRRAIAHAIDPGLVDQRADAGRGLPTSALFTAESSWHSDVGGPDFDPDAARQLLTEARADGYDGRLDFIVLQEPRANAIGLTVQTLLEDVGFDVTIAPAAGAEEIVRRVYVEHDYDLAHAGIGLYESIPLLGLYSAVHSDSSSNFAGYADPEMDALLAELQEADGTEEVRAAIGRIQQLWNETVPSATISGIPILVAMQDYVRGVQSSATNMMLLGGAWLAK